MLNWPSGAAENAHAKREKCKPSRSGRRPVWASPTVRLVAFAP
jgi:hypothetical protein